MKNKRTLWVRAFRHDEDNAVEATLIVRSDLSMRILKWYLNENRGIDGHAGWDIHELNEEDHYYNKIVAKCNELDSSFILDIEPCYCSEDPVLEVMDDEVVRNRYNIEVY